MTKYTEFSNDFLLDAYDFHLPEENIAQSPCSTRDGSRLLIYSKEKKEIQHSTFKNILDFLPLSPEGKKPLFVVNNSKVLPARLFGRSPNQGKRELLLLSPAPFLQKSAEKNGDTYTAIADVLLKPSKNAKIHDIWEFASSLKVEILEKFEFGKHRVKLHWKNDITEVFEKHGSLPLPPYIKRIENTVEDKQRYQTTYANDLKAGSVAAPTAGLHFTEELRNKLIEVGCEWHELTLHVGYGTFTPVRTPDIREHFMHSEFFELPASVAQAILKAKEEKRPVIAVGTTSCRVLEGAASIWDNKESTLLPKEGMEDATNIFIYPHGKQKFQVIDALITNFHLPMSSLLMLVSAFVGREEILEVYKEAVEENYRFFSYGDAMFIRG